jgi:hypothetical protein
MDEEDQNYKTQNMGINLNKTPAMNYSHLHTFPGQRG